MYAGAPEIEYVPSARRVILRPSVKLLPGRTYTVTTEGGPNSLMSNAGIVEDSHGNAHSGLPQHSVTYMFGTGAQAPDCRSPNHHLFVITLLVYMRMEED